MQREVTYIDVCCSEYLTIYREKQFEGLDFHEPPSGRQKANAPRAQRIYQHLLMGFTSVLWRLHLRQTLRKRGMVALFPAPIPRFVDTRLRQDIHIRAVRADSYQDSSVTDHDMLQAEMPSPKQLRIHFYHSAVPMIGFGFMDNLVMIQAGDLIDNTIGVKFGLATLTAAAFGQICSDVSGIAFGGVIEAAATKLGLPVARLSAGQRRLPRVKFIGNFGMICGVILGCLLGMTSLLFKDLDAADRAKREKELDTIFHLVLEHADKVIGAERASLFIYDKEKDVWWSKVGVGLGEEIIVVPAHDVKKKCGIVGESARTGLPLVIENPYDHPSFNSDIDKKLGFKTKNIMCWPVDVSDEHMNCSADVKDAKKPVDRSKKNIVAVIEIINKQSNGGQFSEQDLKLCEMLAYHVSVLLRRSSLDTSPQ
ncbi:hypothetical protein AAMO2058_000182700 [Amorphochlora amoebiformis]